MNIDSWIRDKDAAATDAGEPLLTDAEAASAFNADPANWTNLAPETVYSWLAGNARRYTLRQFAESIDPQADSPQAMGLKSAVGTLMDALQSDRTRLETAPGSEHRQLVDAVATLGLPGVGALDIADLLNKGRLGDEATAQTVAAARAKNARRDAADAAMSANETALSRLREIARVSVVDPAVQPVTLAEVAAPGGYEWTAEGKLEEVTG